jgi:hypothetical protein
MDSNEMNPKGPPKKIPQNKSKKNPLKDEKTQKTLKTYGIRRGSPSLCTRNIGSHK